MRYPGELPRHRYDWKDIPGSSHQILLERVRALPPGLAVLDLGFGAGLLARRIRDRCRYLAGIELDAESAREGASFFDDPVVGDLGDGLAGPWREPFDVVLAADVLEHLPDPASALGVLRGLLKPEGRLFVSLPNVANVTVRAQLLVGRFEYAERGILDRTHLRFYTRGSGRRLLAAAGYRVLSETPTAMPVELAVPALGRAPLAGLARGAASLAARTLPGLFGYQFVFEALPA